MGRDGESARPSCHSRASPSIRQRKQVSCRSCVPKRTRVTQSAKLKQTKAASSKLGLSGATIFLRGCTAPGKVQASLLGPAITGNEHAADRDCATSLRCTFPPSRYSNQTAHDPCFWGMQQPSIKDYVSHSSIAKAKPNQVSAQLSFVPFDLQPKPWLQDSGSASLADGASEMASRAAATGLLLTTRSSRIQKPAEEDSFLSKGQLDGAVAGAALVMPQLSGMATPRRTEIVPTCSIGVLAPDVLAEIFAGVDFKSKMCALLVASRSMRESLQCGAAWDPLCFDKDTGRSFLRVLKKHDPLACFSADVARTKRLFPEGLFDVHRFQVVLMEPERIDQVLSDADDEGPQPQPSAIADPLDEICKRLRRYFTCVEELSVSNIEDFRMDYRYLGLRSGSLSKFGFVELACCDASHSTTYSLVAKRDMPPRTVDTSSAESENRARMQCLESIRIGTTFSPEEALYLTEHRSAFKSGDHFRFKHATFRAVAAHAVRTSYVSVVASLRERFPDRFPKTDPKHVP